ncbi:MAG: hypothetical protein ACI9G1_001067 [Pirellulaceae bacterium]|jgi:hypothetical protein
MFGSVGSSTVVSLDASCDQENLARFWQHVAIWQHLPLPKGNILGNVYRLYGMRQLHSLNLPAVTRLVHNGASVLMSRIVL